MLNVSFVLKEKSTSKKEDTAGTKDKATEKETPIICYLRYNNVRLKYYTGEKINPRHWDDRKESKKYQRAKNSVIEAPELNRKLDFIESTAKGVFLNYQTENENKSPSPEILKGLLDKTLNRVKDTDANSPKTFMSFFSEVIKLSKAGVRLNPRTGKPISANTIKTYNTTYKHLLAFQEVKKKAVDFEAIDLGFYHDYKEFLIKGKKYERKTGKLIPLGLSTNAIAKHFQIIKLIMNEATDRGLTNNRSFKSNRFSIIREKSDSIYLTESEISELEQLDLSNKRKLERVRDLFLIGYYTGQRFSDYSIIDVNKITIDEDGDEFLELTQVKTNNSIQIPIHSNFKIIVSKYGGNLPKSYSNQKVNDYLKDIGKLLSCLQHEVEVNLPTKGNLRSTIKVPKYELLTTHTARRSFATNQYLAGWPMPTIMNITGHKTVKSFQSYIKLTTKEHAKLAHVLLKKRAILKAV